MKVLPTFEKIFIFFQVPLILASGENGWLHVPLHRVSRVTKTKNWFKIRVAVRGGCQRYVEYAIKDRSEMKLTSPTHLPKR